MSLNYFSRNTACESLTRLVELLEQRCLDGNCQTDIDEAVWKEYGQQRAVLYTDLSGFSSSVEAHGIIHFLQVIYQSQKIVHPVIAGNNGSLVKMEADSLLVHFPTIASAVQCALGILDVARAYNQNRNETEWIVPCCGIDFGQILVVGDSDIFGQAVNGASYLGEDVATQWEILISCSAIAANKNSKDTTQPDFLFDYLADEAEDFARLVGWL
jgi:adenylate cyclase